MIDAGGTLPARGLAGTQIRNTLYDDTALSDLTEVVRRLLRIQVSDREGVDKPLEDVSRIHLD